MVIEILRHLSKFDQSDLRSKEDEERKLDGFLRRIEERSGWYSVSKLGYAAYGTRLFASSLSGGRPSPETGPTLIPHRDSASGHKDRDLTPFTVLK
ncbi:hypothetical protein Dsin_002048 [Dipteronia sinensis]|uniref:Uncharacterized protein n=1 Tax=Dipteronia sinensis TaxID=43782 RepID=A0AAE0EJJ9_9ROSI|nr:hypothetical protein Dsin_002048 [Dipteronia sinensis]